MGPRVSVTAVHDYVTPVKALSEPLFFHLITGGPADGAVGG